MNILFDLDGTLIDSSEDILQCLKNAYSSINYPIEDKIDKSIIGPPLSKVIKNISPDLTEDQINIVIKEFRNCYDNNSFSNTKLYNGILELLNYLRKIDFRMFIVTNKPYIITKKILKKLNIDSYFNDVISYDYLFPDKMTKTEMITYLINKWNLEKEDTIVIGDDASDIIAAHNNRLQSIGLLDGYGDKNKLIEAKPTYLTTHEVK